MDEALQDFFRVFNHECYITDEGDNELYPAFLSWDNDLPFCLEYPRGTWTKFAADQDDRTEMIHKPSGLD
jgi:hypothetical protein